MLQINVFFGIYTIPIDSGTPRLSLDFYQVDNLASDDVSSIIGDGLFLLLCSYL